MMNTIRMTYVVMRGLLALLLSTSTLNTVDAQEVVEYIHTDALGSPVAMTDAGGNVIERTGYEPYGAVVNGAVTDSPGYTGHVADSATGLSYMQQRYMDPQLGTFISADPVQAVSGWPTQFGRYRYANSNPYRYTDPDGRAVKCGETRCEGEIHTVGEALTATALISSVYLGRMFSNAAAQSQHNEPAPPPNPDQPIIDDLVKGKTPAPGQAGVKGELQGDPDDIEADWQRIRETPGVRGNQENLTLPGGTHVNRHDSTKPHPDGLVPQKTPTIKVMVTGSKIPVTVRYIRKNRESNGL